MHSNDQYLLEFLEQPHQLTIPIYQRKYSWTIKQCKQLLEDIERIGESNGKDTHFLGAIVFKSVYDRISKKTIIDGQQRITTLNLLIAALANYLYDNQHDEIDIDTDELVDSYLVNPAKKGELYYKLFLTEDDKRTLIKIIDNIRTDEKIEFTPDDSQTVYTNYEFFKKEIKEENVVNVYRGLSKLLIVYIELSDLDNPQLIFESMNSTGLDLSQADLIRNYLLMGLEEEEQEKLYSTYWKKIEKLFEEHKSEVFDKFIRDFLTVNTGIAPVFRNIYADFKAYSRNVKFKGDVERLVKDIFVCSNYFSAIAFGNETDPELKKHLDSLRSMEYDVTYPFLLNLYSDYKASKLSKEDFIKIINLTESYLIRRIICGIPPASYNKTFANIYKELDKDNLLESYKVNLVLKESYHRMPNNEEFTSNFAVKDIYNLRGKNKEYIFDKLENWGYPEKHSVEDYEIEHIMPQNPNLSQEWIDALGPNYKEIQKNYLHTIGNLTLTGAGCNSKLSDKSFLEKRDLEICGYSNTIFRLSKDYLRDLDTWNEEEINKRADKLITRACEIWEYPEVSQETIENYSQNETINQENNLDHILYWNQLKSKAPFQTELKISDNPLVYMPIDNIRIKDAHIVFRRLRQNDEVKCELFLEQDKDLFNYLYGKKEDLESKCNYRFNWLSEPNRKSSKIEAVYSINVDDDKNWDRAIDWQIRIAEMFYEVFSEEIIKFYES